MSARGLPSLLPHNSYPSSSWQLNSTYFSLEPQHKITKTATLISVQKLLPLFRSRNCSLYFDPETAPLISIQKLLPLFWSRNCSPYFDPDRSVASSGASNVWPMWSLIHLFRDSLLEIERIFMIIGQVKSWWLLHEDKVDKISSCCFKKVPPYWAQSWQLETRRVKSVLTWGLLTGAQSDTS